MGEEKRFSVTFEKAAEWVHAQHEFPGSLGTEHLPIEVTTQPVTIGVYSTTEEINTESGRPRGWFSLSLNIAGRLNPTDLTDDECEYVAALLRTAAERFSDMNPFASAVPRD